MISLNGILHQFKNYFNWRNSNIMSTIKLPFHWQNSLKGSVGVLIIRLCLLINIYKQCETNHTWMGVGGGGEAAGYLKLVYKIKQ